MTCPSSQTEEVEKPGFGSRFFDLKSSTISTVPHISLKMLDYCLLVTDLELLPQWHSHFRFLKSMPIAHDVWNVLKNKQTIIFLGMLVVWVVFSLIQLAHHLFFIFYTLYFLFWRCKNRDKRMYLTFSKNFQNSNTWPLTTYLTTMLSRKFYQKFTNKNSYF